MTAAEVKGHRYVLTIECEPGAGAEKLEEMLREIATATSGRLTRGDWGANPNIPNADVWIRRTTLVRWPS